MSNRIKAVLSDVDDTLVNFIIFFECFIKSEFSGNILIGLLFRIAKGVYSLDLVGNSKHTLDLMLYIFAILGFKSPTKVKKDFVNAYNAYLVENSDNIEKRICMLKELQLFPIVKSNNPYGEGFFKKMEGIFFIVLSDRKVTREMQIERLICEYDIISFLGNNITDDVITALNYSIHPIYVGHSVLKKIYSYFFKVTCVSSFEKAIEILTE